MTANKPETKTPVAAKVVLVVFCGLWCLNLLLHIPSFSRAEIPADPRAFPFTGDELVYLTLAREMGWDASNYTTMHDPNVGGWTNLIYRQPLFHHGPALPYLLKTGFAISQYREIKGTAALRAIAGSAFLFANIVMGIYFLQLWRLMKLLDIPPAWQVVGYAGAALGPLILFSTTRLHHDAIAGLLIASGLIAYIEAVEKRSLWWAIDAGILISLALNFRYNSLLAIPLFVGFHCYALWRQNSSPQPESSQKKSKPDEKQASQNRQLWILFLVAGAIIATLGMQHFYRIMATYGTLNPTVFVIPDDDPGDAWFNFKANETRGKILLHLFCTLPILGLFFLPATWKTVYRGLDQRSWGIALTFSFLFLFFVTATTLFSELRFFAMTTPLLYCTLPYLLSQSWPRSSTAFKYIVPLLLALSCFTMLVVGYHYVAVEPNQVVIQLSRAFDLLPEQKPQF